MLVCALAAVPLGLDRVAEAPVVAAGLDLGRGAGAQGVAGAPPLVVLLLRLFACLPIGDLAARANLAAVACAVAAAVLLGRLAFRILRALESTAAAAVGAGTATAAAPVPILAAVGDPGPEPAEAEDPAAGVTAAGTITPVIFEGRSEPWPWPAKRPQLRVLPGAQILRQSAAPVRGSTRSSGRAAPGGGFAQLLAGMAAAPPPMAMMGVSPSRSSRASRARSAAPGVEPAAAHEVFAVVGAIACALGSLATFLALTSAPEAALTLVIVAGAWLQLLAFDRRPGTPRRGLTMVFLAGLALGADPVAVLFIWPAVGLTCVRLLRQGERWPWLAPGAFVAGAVVTLPWATSTPPLVASARAAWSGLRAVTGAFTSADGLAAMLSVVRELIAQWGVVAALTALVGAVILLTRRPRWCGFGAASAALALALVAGENADRPAALARVVPGSAAWVVLSALIVIPLMLGVIRLAGTLGAARGAGALCLAVVAASWPLLDGGNFRFRRGPGLPEALLERAHEGLEPGVVVEPGSAEMSNLFRYGRALGLRPDLEIAAPQPARRPGVPLAVH
jgi:hypothetical protein